MLTNDQKDSIEITELIMAKAGNDWDRCYHGTIERGHDIEGNPKDWGKIEVHDTIIFASAEDQWEHGEKLDEMVLFVLSNPELNNKLYIL